MSATASARFYWSDWRSDPGLRMCSAAARGVWMDMLCLAADAEPVGYVLVNGKTPDARMLARLTGDTVEEVQAALGELEEHGVFSRDEDGRIFSRRMVRDARRAAVARENGSHGGNPALKRSDNRQDNPSVNPLVEALDKASRVQVKDKHSPSEVSEAGEGEVARAKRATAVPPVFTPNEADYQAGAQLGDDRSAVDGEVQSFLDHHTAKGTVFKDWHAAFRTWLRSPYRRRPARSPPNSPGPNADGQRNKLYEATRAFQERLRGSPDGEPGPTVLAIGRR